MSCAFTLQLLQLRVCLILATLALVKEVAEPEILQATSVLPIRGPRSRDPFSEKLTTEILKG